MNSLCDSLNPIWLRGVPQGSILLYCLSYVIVEKYFAKILINLGVVEMKTVCEPLTCTLNTAKKSPGHC